MTRSDWHVVVTQFGQRGHDLTQCFGQHGVEASHMPLIVTEVLARTDIVTQLCALPPRVDGWIFTSATAAYAFADIYRDLPDWKWGKPVCYCIGERTAEYLQGLGLSVQYFEGVGDAFDLAQRLADISTAPHAYVFVRGKQAQPTIPQVLSDMRHIVANLIVYDTHHVPSVEVATLPSDKRVLWILFSPSGVTSLLRNLPNVRELVSTQRYLLLPFGRTTKTAMDEASLACLDMPTSTTHEALIDRVLGLMT